MRHCMHMKEEGALLCAVALAAASASAGTVFTREKAGTIWQDGLLIGDGATAAIGYAPAELEWVVNRNDVLDSRVAACRYLTHEEVMACVKTNGGHSAFLGRAEGPSVKMPADIGDKLTLTLSAAILRIRFWPGVGWAMPSLPDPVGETIWTRERPSGIKIRKVRVPFGVVAVVLESRPNVFIDTAAICLKTGNAVILRKVNHYVLKRMARFLNRKSQRYYRLKFADTYYGEMTHYGLYRLAWADVRRTRT